MIARLPRITRRRRKSHRDRKWRPHFVLLPRVVEIEGVGRCLVWLRTLERRWTVRGGYCWLWRQP